MKKVAILIFDEVEVLDFCGPFEVFAVAGRGLEQKPFDVFTVAEKSGPVIARNGLSVNPRHTTSDCPQAEILIVPGGMGTRREMWRRRPRAGWSTNTGKAPSIGSMSNSFWKNRNAFVTGATGFVGAHIARMLVEQGARVVCLQRDAVRANSLDLFDLRRRVTVVNGSVEDYSLMERIVTEYEIEAVFHLAAQAIVGAANRSPLSTFEANVRGTYSLLEACRRGETVKRVVVASSDKAYGSHDQLPYSEDYPLLGLFPYDASKACTDIIARSYAHTYRTPVVVSRFANIYGPGDLNLSRIIPGTIVSALRDEAPIIRSDGTPVREFVYVDDVARGYLLLAEKIDEVTGEAFNFGAGEWRSVLDLVNRVIRLAGKEGRVEPRVTLDRKIEREIDAQYLSADKAEARLGWRAEIDLDEGLRRTIEWYRAHLDQVQ